MQEQILSVRKTSPYIHETIKLTTEQTSLDRVTQSVLGSCLREDKRRGGKCSRVDGKIDIFDIIG